MAQDFGVLITAPGTDVTNAAGNQIIMNTANAFIKIDTQNKAGFQTITLIITTDPPEPTAGAGWVPVYTQLYKFKHGYTYIPSLETLFDLTTPPAGLTGYQLYSQDSIFLGAHTVDDGAYLYAVADATWVYIICEKTNDGLGSADNLSGTNLSITTHVFVEDIGS